MKKQGLPGLRSARVGSNDEGRRRGRDALWVRNVPRQQTTGIEEQRCGSVSDRRSFRGHDGEALGRGCNQKPGHCERECRGFGKDMGHSSLSREASAKPCPIFATEPEEYVLPVLSF